nr:uncharacterized protein LOC109151078 [Ipomoea batatas]
MHKGINFGSRRALVSTTAILVSLVENLLNLFVIRHLSRPISILVLLSLLEFFEQVPPLISAHSGRSIEPFLPHLHGDSIPKVLVRFRGVEERVNFSPEADQCQGLLLNPCLGPFLGSPQVGGGGGPGPAKQRPSPSFPAVMAAAAAWLGEVDAEVISIVAAVKTNIPPMATLADFWVKLHDLPLGFFSEKSFKAIIGEFILDMADFWVKLHDLPLGFFSEKSFKAIRNFIGEFISLDEDAFSRLVQILHPYPSQDQCH